MNKLSQLLYWADVFGALSTIAGLLGLALLVAGTICFGVSANYRGEEEERRARYQEKPDFTFVNKMRDSFRACAVFAFILICLFVLTPSRSTMYAIAASEMGEQALTTPTATKAFRALDAWLDKQITPAPAAQ